MIDNQTDDLAQALRERGTQYVVGTQGQPVAILLTLDEYQHYLDILRGKSGESVGVFDYLALAAQSSLGFWDNSFDDEDWNNA